MVLMYSRTFSSPSASIFSGVSATANSARVARLTPASVACADSTTATRSVKGLRCSSSPFGSGLAFWKRLKTSRTSSGVQGFVALGFAALELAALELTAFELAALGFDLSFGAFFTVRAGLVSTVLALLALARFADFFGIGPTAAFLAR